MTHTRVFSQVMQEHPKWQGCQPNLKLWHIKLEVGSQVYQLLKGSKQLWKATLWPDTTSLSHMEGFQNRV